MVQGERLSKNTPTNSPDTIGPQPLGRTSRSRSRTATGDHSDRTGSGRDDHTVGQSGSSVGGGMIVTAVGSGQYRPTHLSVTETGVSGGRSGNLV